MLTMPAGPAIRRLTTSPLVVSLGAHILDILGRPVTSIPPGQGSVLLQEIRITAAGTAAGTSVDLAKLGARVVAMGAIGQDEIGTMLATLLERHGVDTSRLARKPGVQTSATMLPIRPNGDRPAFHVIGANGELRLPDVDLAAIAAADVLHVGGPEVLGEFLGAPLARVLATAREHGVLVTMDLLRPGDRSVLRRLRPLLAAVDCFLPNEDQLLAITGLADVDQAIAAVLATGVGVIVVTRGAAGSRVVGADVDLSLPALPAPVLDTTGCGDAYTAGLIIGLCRGIGLHRAAWLGAAAAALVAQGLGSDAILTDFEHAVRYLAEVGSDLGAPVIPLEPGSVPQSALDPRSS